MLPLSISNAKKDSNIYKKIQWNIAQNSELAAGNGDKGDFSQFAAWHSLGKHCVSLAYTSPWRKRHVGTGGEVSFIRRYADTSSLMTRHCVTRPAGRCWRNVLSLRSGRTSAPGGSHPLSDAESKKPNLAVGLF